MSASQRPYKLFRPEITQQLVYVISPNSGASVGLFGRAGSANENGGRKGLRSQSIRVAGLPQPARGMGEQGVNQARLRGEVGAQRLRAALVAGDFVEQALELGDVAVERLLAAAVGGVLWGR